MMNHILKKIFGTRNSRLLKHYGKIVQKINSFEPSLTPLKDEDLQAKTSEFKQRLAKGETLDAILPEVFAVCREASRRVLGMRHFDEQLIGGMVLHEGKISEMRTGEGKTLVATLPAYLNALTGHGVHVITVNDYLAQRDAGIMGKLYNFLGLSVGINLSSMPHSHKQHAYASDITYGTNNEFGFDYLRDNMVFDARERVQRGLHFAIVDEVDSILIDEARTPLIISGPAEQSEQLYQTMDRIPAQLTRQIDEDGEGDFWVDEKANSVLLSEQGHIRCEEILTKMGILPSGESLYAVQYIGLMHHLMAALRAHHLFHRDQHYVIQNNEIIIVDEFTGRLMPGRRWSEGLHQAVEAKEGVRINQENQTMASITFQNYFRLYQKLAGMTGTADTEAYEFHQIYALETVLIHPHKPMIRQDLQDKVFRTAKEKYGAILNDIRECRGRGQPVLVGTTSIENSELISALLKQAGFPHNVLNAKEHAKEADIIAQAGRPGMITVATNMAGRGTDIVLGGSLEAEIATLSSDTSLSEQQREAKIYDMHQAWEKRHQIVLEAGGLHIIGTERHESRRIDNQLRGRSGRQGDPGSSRFYLSLEDPLLRIFASDRISKMMEKLNMPEEAIEHRLVSRAIENAQRKVEGRNFDMRKQLLEYDDVANDQRRVIYQRRNQLLEAQDVHDLIGDMRNDVMRIIVEQHVPPQSFPEQWDLIGLQKTLASDYHISIDPQSLDNLDEEGILNKVLESSELHYKAKSSSLDEASLIQFERSILLQIQDSHWREHLSAMDYLRQGIHLRGYAQKNPKQEYKREAFELFGQMLDSIKQQVTHVVMTVKFQDAGDIPILNDFDVLLTEEQFRQHEQKEQGALLTGRNEPCPCGSGLRYKKCHGKLS
jgi:preprotein translocase subunit SecA